MLGPSLKSQQKYREHKSQTESPRDHITERGSERERESESESERERERERLIYSSKRLIQREE